MLTDTEARDIIAENVRRRLATLDWSQSDLARETGESPMRISYLVRGVKSPTIGFLARVADALETTVDWLIQKHENNSVSAA